MAKIDKMEMKYQNLKRLKFNKEELEKKKAELKGENQNDNQTNKEEKNNLRIKLGKINYEISKLTEKNKLTYEEKTRLEYLKQQRNELKGKQKSSKNDWEKQKQNETDAEKEMNLLEGFVKNEEKIDKILVYRDKIKKDLENQRLEKKTIDTEISKIGNKADLIIEYANLKNEIEEAKKPDSKVSNEDYLKMVAKLHKNEESVKKLNELETKSKKIEKLIKSKQMAVTKCNLAWKCLFRNQIWDDIQLKAIKIKDSRINTNKDKEENKEKITKNEEQKVENIESENKDNIMRRMKTWFFEDKEEEEKEEQQETKEMVEYDKFAKKHPRLAKIRDFFKNRFSRNNKSETKQEQQNKVEQERKEEVEQENKRDAFIEELRRIVEKDDRQDIAQEYIEKHKKVNKEERTTENENKEETTIDEER